MAKHDYRITVNRIPSSRDAIAYTYRTTRCTLTASNGAASVAFSMGAKRDFDDFVSFRVDLAKDAMRKMYLLHALKCDTRLRVRSVIVTVDGESKTYDDSCPGFPFLYSMLTARELHLTERWREPAFLRTVVNQTKTKTENDHRYICLFSFLAGTGKVYEIDRFTCYWTAMNAHYNHLADILNENLPKKQQFTTDADKLTAMLRLLRCGERISSGADRRTHRPQYGAVKSHLQKIPREELPVLCRELYAHRTDRTWVPEGPLGEHLRQCMARANLSAYGFLLLDYAYYIRCNYLHGSKATILFTAANDPEIAAFRTLNRLLGDYLREAIPVMFDDGWLTGETARRIGTK